MPAPGPLYIQLPVQIFVSNCCLLNLMENVTSTDKPLSPISLSSHIFLIVLLSFFLLFFYSFSFSSPSPFPSSLIGAVILSFIDMLSLTRISCNYLKVKGRKLSAIHLFTPQILATGRIWLDLNQDACFLRKVAETHSICEISDKDPGA